MTATVEASLLAAGLLLPPGWLPPRPPATLLVEQTRALVQGQEVPSEAHLPMQPAARCVSGGWLLPLHRPRGPQHSPPRPPAHHAPLLWRQAPLGVCWPPGLPPRSPQAPCMVPASPPRGCQPRPDPPLSQLAPRGVPPPRHGLVRPLCHRGCHGGAVHGGRPPAGGAGATPPYLAGHPARPCQLRSPAHQDRCREPPPYLHWAPLWRGCPQGGAGACAGGHPPAPAVEHWSRCGACGPGLGAQRHQLARSPFASAPSQEHPPCRVPRDGVAPSSV
mmetsp:Transcript_33669/g.103672  ORF Transcript_33669/g.103672 Transcript_33669/m.103672 type:complete len:276 (-) Transcript_33669:1221-2048(-)